MINRYSENDIDKIVEKLNKNGIISIPTDTVYGLCGKIDSKEVFDKLIKLKKRPNSKPFSIMCADIDQINEVALVDEKAKRIIQNFMPGPITIILNKQENIPFYIGNSNNTVAIRMATSNCLKETIKKLECPVFMTSANISGNRTCKSIEEIENLGLNLDAIVEGKVLYNRASTIVDCTKEEIEIIREGPISKNDLRKCLL